MANRSTSAMTSRSSGPSIGPDAHGQAALLLVESLLLELIERGVLSARDAIGVTLDASEVKNAVAHDGDESIEVANHSLLLIEKIAASLSVDVKSS